MHVPSISPDLHSFGGIPSHHGHFLLESGLHAEIWLELESLFLDPIAMAPQLDALADLIASYDITAVCGPLVGGALVAQSIATRLRLRFYIAEHIRSNPKAGLLEAMYRVPRGQRLRAGEERFAVIAMRLPLALRYGPR